ncbi:MAG: hypothetical protein IPO44_09985 [Candidatus Microthrix sp.]|nr:hypothetical protein [Candidatus Microthrix sp.]MBK9559856.1 hypothetical protein [Candidatus Microthrix sp.]
MTDAEPPAGRASGGWTLPREAGWLIAGFAALIPAWGLRGAPGPLYEEGFNVLHAELVLGGQTPGVDFHALYGPLGPWLMAGWFKLVGPSIGAQRVIGALLLIAIVLGVRQLLRPWGRNVATVAAVVTSVVVYAQGSLMAVSWWYGYAAVIWGVLLVRSAGPATSPEEGDVRPTPWETVRLVAGGLLFGLALGARVDLALAVAAAGGAALWAHHDRTAFRGVLGRVAAGGAVGLIPLAAYIWLAGPGRAWRVLVVDPVFTLRPYRTLPPPSFFELQGLNRSLRLAPDWPLPAPGLATQLALWFWISVAAVALLVTVAAIFRREQTRPGSGGCARPGDLAPAPAATRSWPPGARHRHPAGGAAGQLQPCGRTVATAPCRGDGRHRARKRPGQADGVHRTRVVGPDPGNRDPVDSRPHPRPLAAGGHG